MNAVDPIRDKQKIHDMKIYLKGRNLRDYALFVVGINVALRISDLFKLTWADVLNENKKNFNPALIMETLNHSSLNMTKRYLGIRQDEINDLYVSLNV